MAIQVLLSADEIRNRIRALAEEINETYAGEHVTLIGILSGCLFFVADLVRELKLPTRIGFIRASSYRGETTKPGQLEIHDEGLMPEVKGKHVLLLDDILDSGHTLSQVVSHLKRHGPKSIRSAVLLRKLGRQVVAFEPDFTGFEIPNLFVIGYGLDYDDDYRQLPYLGVLEGEAI